MDASISSSYFSELRTAVDNLFDMELQVVPAISCSVDRDEYTGLNELNDWRDSGCDNAEDPDQFGLEGAEILGIWSENGSAFDGFFPVTILPDGEYVIVGKWRERTPEEIHRQIDLAEEYGHPLGIAVNTLNFRHVIDQDCQAPNAVIYSDPSTLHQLVGESSIRIESDGNKSWAYPFIDFRSDDIFDWFDGASPRHFGLVGRDCSMGQIRKGAIVPAYPSYVLGKQIQLVTPGTKDSKLIILSAQSVGIHFDVVIDDEDFEVNDHEAQGSIDDIWAGKNAEIFSDPSVDEYGIPHYHPLDQGTEENECTKRVSHSGEPEKEWFDLLFPPDLANACRCLTENLPYDETTVSMSYLTGIASLLRLGTKINGNPLTKYIVPPCLYVANVGKSGSKKTYLKTLAIDDPARQIRLQISQANTRELQKWENDCRGIKKDERPSKPVPLKIRTQEYSSEALVANLQKADEHGRSFGIFRDELNGLFKNMNRYAKGQSQGGDEEQLLELFDGNPFDSSRITNPRSYERCSVSIYGNLQPRVFADLTKEPDATGQWARFLFVPFPEKTVPLPVECTEEEQRKVEAATGILESYAKRAYDLDPRIYTLDLEARKTFRDYELDKQHGVHSAPNETQSALHGKSAAKVLRIVGLIHILSILHSQPKDPSSISADELRRAIALVDYLDHWVLSQYTSRGVTARSPIAKEMRRLHNLATKLGETVSWSQIKDGLSSKEARHMNRMKAEEHFRSLEAMGYGKVSFGRRGGLCYTALKPLPAE